VNARSKKESRFSIMKLEMRIAPAPAMVRIPSTDVGDPAVNGAEHACKGLSHAVHNPNQAVQLYRHGCDCAPPPPPSCPPPPPCGCGS
jgi:hypothetical protein